MLTLQKSKLYGCTSRAISPFLQSCIGRNAYAVPANALCVTVCKCVSSGTVHNSFNQDASSGKTSGSSSSSECSSTSNSPADGDYHDKIASSSDSTQDHKGTLIRHEDLPESLKNLKLTESGLLMDETTGKVINAFGATRFDVHVRALRGELDPPEWMENTEKNPGVLLSALRQFPMEYCFQAVAATGGPGGEAFVSDMVALISRVCEAEVSSDKVQVAQRLHGKYQSLQVDVMVRAPEVVSRVFAEMRKDTRVKMCF